MRILVDIDSTLNDLAGYFCKCISKEFKINLTPQTLNNYEMSPWLVEGEYNKYIYNGLFKEFKPLKGSRKVLKKASETHSIIIVSQTGPATQREKVKWVQKHYPYVKEIIFTADKHLIPGDMLIDDNPRHLRDFPGHKVTLGYGYNQDIPSVWYADNWKEIGKIIKTISYVEELKGCKKK